MGKIRIDIYKSSAEWGQLKKVISEKYNAADKSATEASYSRFLHNETNRLFQNIEIGDCTPVHTGKSKKHFELNLPDEIEEKINCQAKRIGISPNALIIRMVLDPHLTSI